MIEALFIFTAVMVITATIKFIGLILGNDMQLPYIIPGVCSPGNFAIWYPSALFQVWFWADKLGVFS